MTQLQLNTNPKGQLWEKVDQQVSNLARLKDKKTRRRQIVLICESIKRALKGDK